MLVCVFDDVGVVEVTGWASGLDDVAARIGGRFARSEPRRRVGAYLRGLLSATERKNGWTLAEQAGDATPDAMQRLLNHADWDADAVRDDLRAYVVETLADPDAVLVVDETGFLKKGDKSVGVQRQYTGTAGRIENAQVGVFLAYAAAAGRTFIDRALYLPKSWCDDADRRAEAKVPDDTEFQTKPEIALDMVTRALEAEVPAKWVAGDEVYGQHSGLRLGLEELGIGYVLAVPVKQRTPALVEGRVHEVRVDQLATDLPETAWERLSAGDGAKGPRTYDWTRVPVRPLEDGDQHWMLVRRRISDGELAYYLCYTPGGASLTDLVSVAGRRWAIEESFQTAKGEVGLDHYQVRTWPAWHRHITLACLAHAYLTASRAATNGEKGGSTSPTVPSRDSPSPRSDT